MLKKLVFAVLGIFSISLFGGVLGCDDVCLSLERCYECVNNNISECVPIYTNSSRILDTYSDWNCTEFNKETYIKKILDSICQVDSSANKTCDIRIESPFKCDEQCLSSVSCYQCVNNNSIACIPTYTTNESQILETSTDWNCTVFKEKTDTNKLLQTICKIDNFADKVCNITDGNDYNNLCIVADYVKNICEKYFKKKTLYL